MTDADLHHLPVDLEEGTAPVAFWGMWLFITTEAVLFATLLASYFYVRFRSAEWPLGGIEAPELTLPLIGTALLLGSSGVAHWAEKGIEAGNLRRLRLGLVVTILMGTAFLGVLALEYLEAPFSPSTNVYGSFFFGITGFHGLHVLVGVAMLTAVASVAFRSRRYTAERHLPVRLAITYWHFVDVVWIFVLSSLYLLEHL